MSKLYQELSKFYSMKSKDVWNYRNRIIQLLAFCNKCNFDKMVWHYLPFSKHQWRAWYGKKHCVNSLQGLCRKQNTQQLSIKEQNEIHLACSGKQYSTWPLCSIYYQLLRDQKIHCSQSTFYKYCRLMNIIRKQIRKPKKYVSITTDKPLKVLHQDITIFKTVNGVKHYVYVSRDNFSKAILACKTTTMYSSEIAKQTLASVLERFDLMDKSGTLITDDGVENKGTMLKFLKESATQWKQLIAQIDIVQSNSIIEAANKILKYRYLYINPVNDTDELIKGLEVAMESYNNIPNAQLFGLTPNEVLKGVIPDKHKFKAQLETGKNLRVNDNRNFDCAVACRI